MEELKDIHSEGNTIIMVTHNPALTVYATRVINMLDGQIDTDIKTVEDDDLPQPVEIHFRQRNVLKEVKEALSGKGSDDKPDDTPDDASNDGSSDDSNDGSNDGSSDDKKEGDK